MPAIVEAHQHAIGFSDQLVRGGVHRPAGPASVRRWRGRPAEPDRARPRRPRSGCAPSRDSRPGRSGPRAGRRPRQTPWRPPARTSQARSGPLRRWCGARPSVRSVGLQPWRQVGQCAHGRDQRTGPQTVTTWRERQLCVGAVVPHSGQRDRSRWSPGSRLRWVAAIIPATSVGATVRSSVWTWRSRSVREASRWARAQAAKRWAQAASGATIVSGRFSASMRPSSRPERLTAPAASA